MTEIGVDERRELYSLFSSEIGLHFVFLNKIHC